MATVAQLLRSGADLPGDSARRDTEILLCACIDKPRSWLYAWPEATVAEASAAQFSRLLAQRRQGQPIAYLLGVRDFWSLTLRVDPSTLIPRPETEVLVSWALELPLAANVRVLDMGTGSGAIALALASERPAWSITGIDNSVEALRVAQINAQATGLESVEFLQSDWYAQLGGACYHLICANPPYISSQDEHLQQGDLRFEPRSALAADEDGLADLRWIIAGARQRLLPGGWLLVEHGFEQGAAVRQLFVQAGLNAVTTRCDLAGHERISGGCNRAE